MFEAVGNLPDNRPPLDVLPVHIGEFPEVKEVLEVLMPRRQELQYEKVFLGRYRNGQARRSGCTFYDQCLKLSLSNLQIDRNPSRPMFKPHKVRAGSSAAVLLELNREAAFFEEPDGGPHCRAIGENGDVHIHGDSGLNPTIDGLPTDERGPKASLIEDAAY